MEPNGLVGGGIFPSINSGMLGVENPLKQQPNLQNQQNPHTLHHPQMVSYATHHDTDTTTTHPQPQPSVKQGYPYSAKTNKPQTTLSDEDEPGFAADDSCGDPNRKVSPWHRMKWTDTMVRLLIMAVYYIGDEGGSEGTDPNGKKKATGNLLQKKGKWKSVSRGMMEKGYYVSPQQCEDKFNDLNKRYKRVNDILGKGTACRVVENQSLLDTMDLSPKMKEEARKLLNSKHLFFREMCAYHNSCGHGSSSGGACNNVQQQSSEAGTEAQPQQQQRCLHSSENGVGSLRMLKGRSGEEEEDEDEDDEWEDYSEEEEEESGEGGGSKGQVEEDENDVITARKRSRKGGLCASNSMSSQVVVIMQQLSSEVTGVLQDGGKSPMEKKQWMKKRVVQLEEQQISYQVEAFELEKQRLKWARFSSNKERAMETHQLENQRRRLEIDRMVLLLRQKELELMNIQQQQPST